jgi:hypothetical protein
MRLQMYMLHQIYIYKSSYVYSYVYSVSKLSEVEPVSERLKAAKIQVVTQAMDTMGGMHNHIYVCMIICIHTYTDV